LPKPAVKVLLNLSAIAIDALVRGGTLAIGAERRDGATEIAVRATGPRVAFDANIGKALDGSLAARELTGRTAPAHMIRLLADELGGGVQYALSAEALVMGAILPDRAG
jgi:histidine phosphotransferase ChpT